MERNGVLNSICQVVALVLITLEMNKLALCLFSVEQPQIGYSMIIDLKQEGDITGSNVHISCFKVVG